MPTPLHTYRCENNLYLRALAVARSRDESLSDVIRSALVRYVRRYE
jgi:hypothetical protein